MVAGRGRQCSSKVCPWQACPAPVMSGVNTVMGDEWSEHSYGYVCGTNWSQWVILIKRGMKLEEEWVVTCRLVWHREVQGGWGGKYDKNTFIWNFMKFQMKVFLSYLPPHPPWTSLCHTNLQVTTHSSSNFMPLFIKITHWLQFVPHTYP